MSMFGYQWIFPELGKTVRALDLSSCNMELQNQGNTCLCHFRWYRCVCITLLPLPEVWFLSSMTMKPSVRGRVTIDSAATVKKHFMLILQVLAIQVITGCDQRRLSPQQPRRYSPNFLLLPSLPHPAFLSLPLFPPLPLVISFPPLHSPPSAKRPPWNQLGV